MKTSTKKTLLTFIIAISIGFAPLIYPIYFMEPIYKGTDISKWTDFDEYYMIWVAIIFAIPWIYVCDKIALHIVSKINLEKSDQKSQLSFPRKMYVWDNGIEKQIRIVVSNNNGKFQAVRLIDELKFTAGIPKIRIVEYTNAEEIN